VNIAAIILAAGRSRRMGTQKLLLPLAGQTVIGHIFDQVVGAGVGHIYVVASVDRQAVTEVLGGHDFTLVENPNPDGDMLSSIRCGLRALPANIDAALICLGDQPGIQTALVVQLLRLYEQSKCGIALPIASGKRGHPVMLSSKYFGEVLADFDDVGLQGLLQAHPDDICFLAVDDPDQLSDMDYPPDYERAIRNLGGSTHGSP
jgi:molybdenum cofactor cytidylyltransferase